MQNTAADNDSLAHAEQPKVTREQITELVDEVAELTNRDVSAAEFHALLLDRTIAGAMALAGFVWVDSELTSNGSATTQPAAACGLNRLSPNVDTAFFNHAWRTFFASVSASEQPVLLAGKAISVAGEFRNPFEQAMTANRFFVDEDRAGGIVLFHSTDLTTASQNGIQQLLAVLCELATEFHRNRCLRELRQQARLSAELERIRQTALKCDDPEVLTASIANDGRRFVQCGRLTVLLRSRQRYRVASISGVDAPDRRATMVRAVEKLAAEVATATKADINDDDATSRYQAAVGATHVVTYPLRRDGDNEAVHSVLVIEFFDAGDATEGDKDQQARAALLAEHLAPVLGLMDGINAIPLLRFGRWLQRRTWLRSLPRWRWKWVAATLLTILVAGLIFVPADFEVEAHGTLQPVEQQFIYAPRDGIVFDFPDVDTDMRDSGRREAVEVHSGDILIQLLNADLDYEFTRVLGEQQTLAKRLDSVTVLLQEQSRAGNSDRVRLNQLTAEKLELEIEETSLSQQLQILRAEKQQLSLVSRIDGQIQTWNFVSRLRSRPVRQGSHLMTVANLDGNWRLELQIPDRHIDALNEARANEQLPVRYVVKSAPEQHHQASLGDIAAVTKFVESHGLSVAANADLDRGELPQNVRPGTAVIAKIHCGRRSVGYVWLHDLIRSVRQRLLF